MTLLLLLKSMVALFAITGLSMTLSNAAEDALLKLMFNNTNWANVGDATGLRGSTAAGSFYIALHTANPGETGDQSTSECAYGGYARVAVARTSGAFTVSGTAPTQVANVAAISFPACTSGSEVASHFSIGVASSGATVAVLYGALNATLAISAGITPTFAIAALVANAD